MEPFELVALTPKSNCGDCGHPTCLAFAVAVTRGGALPGRCPYIDSSSLPPELGKQLSDVGLKDVAKGQQSRDLALVAQLKSKITQVDFKKLAPVIGADYSSSGVEQLTFTYLGRLIQLSKENVTMAGEALVDPRDQILLYNYIAFGGGRSPDGTWVGMESLPNSISKVRTLETYCEKKIAACFSGRSIALEKNCQLIGGKANPDDFSATLAMVVPVLPQLPLVMIFWDQEPEDGFDARVKILFDHHVLEFLDLESLVFTAERMADHLVDLEP